MKAIHPYLNFPGTAEQAFALYRSVFGGELTACQRFKDMPGGACPGGTKPADGNKILHICLPLANGTMLMASDSVDGMGPPLQVGNHASICVDVESRAEADRLFAGLSAGGTVHMAMQEMFWGAYWGMCTDRFGVQWMVNHPLPGSR